jgi:integrase
MAGFTDISIRNLKPGPVRREIRDPGCEHLYLIIQPNGRKSFAVRYRFKGKPQKLTLGTLGSISLKAAREAATAALHNVEKDKNPAAAKRLREQDRKTIEAITFEVVAEQYLKIVCGKRLGRDAKPIFNDEVKTAARLDAELKRLVYRSLGDRPISEIRRSEVVGLLDAIQTGELKDGDGKPITGGPVVADRTLALIRTIFNWHAKRSDDFRSPLVAGMERTKTRERARDRKLSDDEIRKIWDASAEGTFPLFVRFLLLTAARRGEASAMTWDEIDGADWTLPGDAEIGRNKVSLDLVRPLSDAALAVIEKLRRDDGCRYVFSTNGRTPINAFGRSKREFDKQTGTTGWRLHDLRRTARSLMSRAAVNSDHAERCLGHTIGGVQGTYDRHEYYDEKKSAYDALASLIQRIVDPPEGNVTTLRTKRA